MYTRQEYLSGQCSYSDYYGQAVTPSVTELVINHIGSEKIINSTDKYFNDIPLKLWDQLHPYLRNNCLKDTSLATSVCIAKEAARRWKTYYLNDKKIQLYYPCIIDSKTGKINKPVSNKKMTKEQAENYLKSNYNDLWLGCNAIPQLCSTIDKG